MLPQILMGFAGVLCKVLYGLNTDKATNIDIMHLEMSEFLKDIRSETENNHPQQEGVSHQRSERDSRQRGERYLIPLNDDDNHMEASYEDPGSAQQALFRNNTPNQDTDKKGYNPDKGRKGWKNRH